MEKIEKLELNNLCGYLPYGLNFIIESGLIFKLRATHIFNNHTGIYKGLEKQAKILLLPLSALIEPLPDGSVPIVELAKIAGFIDFEVLQVKEGSTAYIATLSDDYKFMVLKSNCDFAICKGKNIIFSPNQLQLFEYLYSIHADIYELIPAGLAIDKRVVKIK